MQTSDKGIAFIEQWEGFVNHVYNDVAGNPTVGFGHLVRPGEQFPIRIDETRAAELLKQDVKEAEDAVNRLVTEPMTQNQFDALVDFCFNLGAHKLETMLGHGWDEVPEQIPRWCYAKDPVSGQMVKNRGLERRRTAEVELFNS